MRPLWLNETGIQYSLSHPATAGPALLRRPCSSSHLPSRSRFGCTSSQPSYATSNPQPSIACSLVLQSLPIALQPGCRRRPPWPRPVSLALNPMMRRQQLRGLMRGSMRCPSVATSIVNVKYPTSHQFFLASCPTISSRNILKKSQS